MAETAKCIRIRWNIQLDANAFTEKAVVSLTNIINPTLTLRNFPNPWKNACDILSPMPNKGRRFWKSSVTSISKNVEQIIRTWYLYEIRVAQEPGRIASTATDKIYNFNFNPKHKHDIPRHSQYYQIWHEGFIYKTCICLTLLSWSGNIKKFVSGMRWTSYGTSETERSS